MVFCGGRHRFFEGELYKSLFEDNAKIIMKSHYRNITFGDNLLEQTIKTNLLIKTSRFGYDFDPERYFIDIPRENVYHQVNFCSNCGDYVEMFIHDPELKDVAERAKCKCM